MEDDTSSKTAWNVPDITPWYIASRSLIVSLMMVLGIAGNGFVLWFYGKNKKLTGQVYILALAVIDIASCVTTLPLLPMLELDRGIDSLVFEYVLVAMGALQLVSYIGVQVAMALDQFIAVFWPFKLAQWRQKLNWVMLASCIFLMTFFVIFAFILKALGKKLTVYLYTLTSFTVISLLVLLIIYPTTAYKLYRRNRTVRPRPQVSLQKAGAATATAASGTARHGNTQQTASEAQKSEMHVQALKIYTCILLQYLTASVIGLVGSTVFNQYIFYYLFYVNHIGNPVIYYAFVPKFRDGAKENLRALGCRRKK